MQVMALYGRLVTSLHADIPPVLVFRFLHDDRLP